MKTRRMSQKLSALALCAALFAGTGEAAAAGSQTEPNFYQQLSQLVSSQDKTFFFASMQFTLGSNVLTVDGKQRPLGAVPEVRNERTMLPIQELAAVVGAKVNCDSRTRSAVIVSRWGDTIACYAGKTSMEVNGKSIPLDVPAYWKDGSFYLPVRAVAEAMFMEVRWNQETQSVILTSPYQTSRIVVYANALDNSVQNAQVTFTDGKGMWVVQFATPAEAKAAVEHFKAKGATAGPDAYTALF